MPGRRMVKTFLVEVAVHATMVLLAPVWLLDHTADHAMPPRWLWCIIALAEIAWLAAIGWAASRLV